MRPHSGSPVIAGARGGQLRYGAILQEPVDSTTSDVLMLGSRAGFPVSLATTTFCAWEGHVSHVDVACGIKES